MHGRWEEQDAVEGVGTIADGPRPIGMIMEKVMFSKVTEYDKHLRIPGEYISRILGCCTCQHLSRGKRLN